MRGTNEEKNKKIDDLKKKLDRSRYISWPYLPDNPMQSTLDYVASIQNPSGSTFSAPYMSMQESIEDILRQTHLEELQRSLENPLTSKFKMPKAGEWPLTMKDYPWGSSPKDKKK